MDNQGDIQIENRQATILSILALQLLAPNVKRTKQSIIAFREQLFPTFKGKPCELGQAHVGKYLQKKFGENTILCAEFIQIYNIILKKTSLFKKHVDNAVKQFTNQGENEDNNTSSSDTSKKRKLEDFKQAEIFSKHPSKKRRKK